MATHLELIHINDRVSPRGFGDFIRKVIFCMKDEIENTIQAFYTHTPDNQSGAIKTEDRIHSSLERTWVALFNDSLKKADPKVHSLQEFAVWSDDRHIGRCDLLFEWDRNLFFTEAKSREYNRNWRLLVYEESFGHFFHQANGYYTAEKDWHRKDAYLIVLIFEWFRHNNLEKILREKNDLTQSLEEITDDYTKRADFAALYYGTERGLLMYGKLEKTPYSVLPAVLI